MKNTIKLVIFLAIVAALSGLVLGYVNSITKPIIEENEIKVEKQNLEKMCPGAEFTIMEFDEMPEEILGVYEANGTGYIFKCAARGYHDDITTLIGLDYDGTIFDVIILSNSETSGVGTKVFDKLDSLYIGKTIDQDVDILSGATYTSNGMIKMINASKDAFKSISK